MAGRAPWVPQLVGLGVTLAAVAVYFAFTLDQVRGLQKLQVETVDRNRRDALQLIRIQNDLYQTGLALHEMAEADDPLPLTAHHGEMDRLHADLEGALIEEQKLAPASRTREQQALLDASVHRLWDGVDQMWMLVLDGRENEARALIRTRVSAERGTLDSNVARLLVQNSDAASEGARAVGEIYRRVEINLYWFLAAGLLAISATGFSALRFSRRIYGRLERLSEERQELARKMINVQEETFRALARELHDEFGQVLTALGAMLQQVKKRIPEDSPAQDGLKEIREVAAGTLERVRLMSQALHPTVLDDYGLGESIEGYLRQYEKQSGIRVHYEKIGDVLWIGDQVAIHVYRILQEALNNVQRHAKVDEVWVRAEYEPARMTLVVEDHGRGMPAEGPRRGIGLISMRERAGLLGGKLEFLRPVAGGVRVTLEVPLRAGAAA